MQTSKGKAAGHTAWQAGASFPIAFKIAEWIVDQGYYSDEIGLAAAISAVIGWGLSYIKSRFVEKSELKKSIQGDIGFD